jgi:hypothetical protein
MISLSIAWDYAARVCLRMRENLILWPPQAPAENNADHAAYELFSGFSILNADQIKAFELRHSSTPAKSARRKIHELKPVDRKQESYEYNSNTLPPTDTIHISLPHNSGHITKSSIGWLYSAIVCLVLGDISKNLPLPKYIIREFGMSIIMTFSLFINMVDNRYSIDWFELFKLSKAVNGGSGHHAASAASSTGSNLCKHCSKNVRRDSSDFIEMEFSAELQNWKCPKCGGTEQLKVRALTPRYIRKIQDKVLQRAKDITYYLPIFEQVKSMYNYIINKNKEDILKRFEEYEKLATKDLLIKREGFFMIHYDPSKKWKKRVCYVSSGKLAYIESNDNRYHSQYEPLINELARKVSYDKGLANNEGHLLQSISNELEEIGWPKHYLKVKIDADIDHLKS